MTRTTSGASRETFADPGFILSLPRPYLEEPLEEAPAVVAGSHWLDTTHEGFGVMTNYMGPHVLRDVRFLFVCNTTNSGIFERPVEHTTAGEVLELHRRSGLTWHELSRLFGVDRRSLHLWARGAPPAPRNEARLRELLELVRSMSASSQMPVRQQFKGIGRSGKTIFDVLVREQVPPPRRARSQHRPDARVLASRQGPRATELLDAIHTRVNADPGRFLGARPLRGRKK